MVWGFFLDRAVLDTNAQKCTRLRPILATNWQLGNSLWRKGRGDSLLLSAEKDVWKEEKMRSEIFFSHEWRTAHEI